jgi:hypothetical protein
VKSKSTRGYQIRPSTRQADISSDIRSTQGKRDKIAKIIKIFEINLMFLFRYPDLYDEAIFGTCRLQRRVMGDLER